MKKYIAGIFGIIFISFGYAKVLPIWPGEVIGRDFNVKVGKFVGHVGLTTGDATRSPTTILIEVLNEEPVIQINDLYDFKSRSKYWGSRWGIGDQNTKTHNLLVEANHQRWWGAYYTPLPKYELGEGDLSTGDSISKGTFRCDTFVSWAFSTQGYNQLLGLMVMTPRNVFNTFPNSNNEIIKTMTSDKVKAPFIAQNDLNFDSLTVYELNQLTLEEFLMIADVPPNHITPTHIVTEWKLAKNEELSDEKRGALIDNLSFSKEANVIEKFIQMYNETFNPEIKTKLLIGLDRYSHNVDFKKTSDDKKLLQDFYEKILNSNLSSIDYNAALYTYLNINNPEYLLSNTVKIDNALSKMSKEEALRSYIKLVHRSKELEQIYVPELISFLKQSNSSSLDEMFFGTTKMGIKSFKDVQTISQIKEYLESVKERYSSVSNKNLQNNDPYFAMAKSAYHELYEEIKGM